MKKELKKVYSKPTIKVVSFNIEKGFAGSITMETLPIEPSTIAYERDASGNNWGWGWNTVTNNNGE